eukprot:Nitzschia sp. Nitz4//scaffold219_size35776//10734//13049//NITZ4_007820-RA/size35776-snap-gene-0.67-mRNA-1//-1//CDS//3329542308//4067//frame0
MSRGNSSNPVRRRQGTVTNPGSSTSTGSGSGSIQGVLWKRRDVFRNGWRPRWFVLHPQEAILTYYLLNENAQLTSTATAHVATSSPTNRNRTDSDFSMDTMDYDVIPRGSIYLGGPTCSAKANDKFTRPEEHLYTIEISDGQHSTSSFLAARTSTDRDRWLEKIQQVIHQHQVQPPSDHPVIPDPSAEVEQPVPMASSERSVVQPDGGSFPVSSNRGWSTMDSPRLLQNVPEDVATRIQSMIQTYLPLANTEDYPDWTFSYSNDDLKVYRHRTSPMVRSIYKTTRSHPAQYLRLLWDLPRVVEFQPNVRYQEQLHSYNAHTNLVYTAYNPVWPTSARDFCSVVHWRLIHNQHDERALCVVAFSSPHAESLRPVPSDHVRGILNVSFNLWTPTSSGDGCVHTRILSYDMNGSIPQKITQTIMQQQAALPRQLDLFLRRTNQENSDPSVPLDYDSLYHYLHMAPDEPTHHIPLANIKEESCSQQVPTDPNETATTKELSKINRTMKNIELANMSKYLESMGKSADFDVSPILDHLILREVTQTMRRHKTLLVRSVPFLPPLYNMGIRWQVSGEDNFKDIWLPLTETTPIQEVATALDEALKAPATNRTWQHLFVGDSCRVLKSETELGFSFSKPPNESVLILLSMYPPILRREGRETSGSADSTLQELRKARLHVWVIVNDADAEQGCRSFAEDLRNAILRPK